MGSLIGVCAYNLTEVRASVKSHTAHTLKHISPIVLVIIVTPIILPSHSAFVHPERAVVIRHADPRLNAALVLGQQDTVIERSVQLGVSLP